MKHILYKVGFTVLIIAAVIGITGGVAMADSPAEPSPLAVIQATVNEVKTTVNSILGALNGPNGLAAIKSDVSTVKANVAALDSKVDAIAANVTRMKTYTFCVYPITVNQVYEIEFNEPSSRHVSISFSGKNFGVGDYMKIIAYFGFEDLEIVDLAGEAANGPHRVEFDTFYYKISLYDASPGGTASGFVITETYGMDSSSSPP